MRGACQGGASLTPCLLARADAPQQRRGGGRTWQYAQRTRRRQQRREAASGGDAHGAPLMAVCASECMLRWWGRVFLGVMLCKCICVCRASVLRELLIRSMLRGVGRARARASHMHAGCIFWGPLRSIRACSRACRHATAAPYRRLRLRVRRHAAQPTAARSRLQRRRPRCARQLYVWLQVHAPCSMWYPGVSCYYSVYVCA